MMPRIYLLCSLFILLVACAPNKKLAAPEPTPEQLYQEAENLLTTEHNYKKAAQTYADLTHRFPYYEYANRAQVMEIYAYFLQGDYDSAIFAAENYIKIHPASPYMPYIHYMKALCYYAQIDLPYRDQENTMKAHEAFQELAMKYPQSNYAQDALLKIDLTEDYLAAHEMIVGRYYLHKGNIIAAIKNFTLVVQQYSRTSHIEEALYRLAEGYTFIGQKEEARKHIVVLKLNYPQTVWYERATKLIS